MNIINKLPRQKKKRNVQCGTRAVQNIVIVAQKDEDDYWRSKIQNTVDGQHLSIQTNSPNTAR